MKKILTLLMAIFFSTIYSGFAISHGGFWGDFGRDPRIKLYCDSDSTILISIYQHADYPVSVGRKNSVNIIDIKTGQFISSFHTENRELDYDIEKNIRLDTNSKQLEVNNIHFDYITGDTISKPFAPQIFHFNLLRKLEMKNYGADTLLIKNLKIRGYIEDNFCVGDIPYSVGYLLINDRTNSNILNIIPEDFIGVGYSNLEPMYITEDGENIVQFSEHGLFFTTMPIISIYNIQEQKLNRYLLNYPQINFIYPKKIWMNYGLNKLNLILNNKIYGYNLNSKTITDSLVFDGVDSISSFTNDNHYLLLYTADSVKVWDDSSKTVIARFKEIIMLDKLKFSAESKVISTYSNFKVIQYDFKNSSVCEYNLPNLQSLNYKIDDLSSDGKYLLCKYGEQQNMHLLSWDVENDKLKLSIQYFAPTTSHFLIAPYSFYFQEYLEPLRTYMVNMLNNSVSISGYFSEICDISPNNNHYVEYTCAGIYSYYTLPERATTSVQDIKFDGFNAEIYPNPANDKINVNGISEGNYTLRISNLSGEVMHSSNVLISGNSNFEFDIKSLPTGAYVLELKNSTQSYTGKFSKVK